MRPRSQSRSQNRLLTRCSAREILDPVQAAMTRALLASKTPYNNFSNGCCPIGLARHFRETSLSITLPFRSHYSHRVAYSSSYPSTS